MTGSALQGLPEGLFELMDEYVAEANEWLGIVAGERLSGDRTWSARQLLLPRLVDSTWPAPSAPIAVGSGWVHADLIAADLSHFARILDELQEAELVAAEAQAGRLPVTPYRRELRPVRDEALEFPASPRERSLHGVRVVDLTTLWAGPLATSLLAASGAEVLKIDPSVRRDGFHARPTLYAELNARKQILDLDLRAPKDRRHFEALVASADLVVDSFSRRVLRNFGYSPDELRRIRPQIGTLSIVAFPAASGERDWLSYGGGVHAVSGLGMANPAASLPLAAPVAYPDPLTGMRAFTAALRLLASSGEPPHVEVSLLGSVAPLVDRALASY